MCTSMKNNQFRTNNITINKHTKLHKALLRFKIINKYKVYQNLGQFFDFVQSIIDIGNLFHSFVLFCSEESNLNVGRFVNIALLAWDTVTHTLLFVCCYFIYSITDVALLIHSWFFTRFGFIYRYKSKNFSIVNNSIPDFWYCFSFILTKKDLLGLFKLSQIIHF